MAALPRNPFGPGPIGLAHRGGAAEAPENTRSAFQHAVDVGTPWIETDVRASRDGRAIVFHDEMLDRTADAHGPIAARTLAELSGVRLADGHPPLSLVEALRTWPDTGFNVDVKSPDAIGPFLRAVADTGAWDRVCAASFSVRRLRELRRHAGPQLATSLGGSEVVRLVIGGRARVDACAAQVPAVVGGRDLVTTRFIARAHAIGLLVHAWTVNDRTKMRDLLDLGVDGIVTDHPSVLAELLRAPRGGPA